MNANELADYLDKCVVGNENDVYHQAVNMLRKQAEEIEYWKDKFNKAMQMQEPKPAKYTDAWWKEVEEFNKRLKEKKND
jgi:hypothetical protein